MNVVGFSGYSGSGKTTLVEQLITRLRLAGLRVSVVKHAHHDFDIDHPGKDSFRHREAGAFEVVIASSRRLAKVREFEQHGSPSVHQLIAELYDCDWVLVEGFKHASLPRQFDAVLHYDSTRAVEPLELSPVWAIGEAELPETFPSAL